MEFKKICVLGLGYIGLPTASTFATNGVKVIGVDVNPQVVETLRSGKPHIFEPGLRTLVQAALGSGNLVISDQPEPADGFIIAVPTPFYDDKRADLRFVISAAEAIVPHLRAGQPGGARIHLAAAHHAGPRRADPGAFRPESRARFPPGLFARAGAAGQILRELIENARVIGGIDRASPRPGATCMPLFVRGEIIQTDATTAEMVKLMENTYRDVNIAIANEFARLAERFGVDVWEAISLANRHPRVNILRPGPAWAGTASAWIPGSWWKLRRTSPR